MGPVSHGGGGRLGPGARPRRWASTPHGACASPWLRSRGCVWSAPRDTLTAPARPEGCECQPTIPRARVVFSCRPGTATLRCGARAVCERLRAHADCCDGLSACKRVHACMHLRVCVYACAGACDCVCAQYFVLRLVGGGEGDSKKKPYAGVRYVVRSKDRQK